MNLFDWDDKIVHLLEGIYEEAFLGFSYGVQHDVLTLVPLDCQIGVFLL